MNIFLSDFYQEDLFEGFILSLSYIPVPVGTVSQNLITLGFYLAFAQCLPFAGQQSLVYINIKI